MMSGGPIRSAAKHADAPAPRASTSGLILPTAVIGIGLSGFFDGILLHQILQWHHLLSLVPGEPFRDLGTQILADGLFHILMYVITAAGLWLLWRRRSLLAVSGGRVVAGGALLGFGLWNVVDVGIFHWLLGLHRIRVNVPDPLLYDVVWLTLFGCGPLSLAWRTLRQNGFSRRGGGGVTISILAMLALAGAGGAARPVKDTRTAIVLFTPGTSPGEGLDAAANARVRAIWVDPRGRMMAVSLDDQGAEQRLYRQGALLVTRSPVLAGCGTRLRA
ncbi:putative membrane protein [Sphingomonas zeicaulis]|uniref:DUF2243 domain-containing protein n=1 Tax=Sphingomonas zeicaulis TaxID=1632740 RepID=UPI003D2557F7